MPTEAKRESATVVVIFIGSQLLLLSLAGFPLLTESFICEFKLLIWTTYMIFTFRPLKSTRSEEMIENIGNSSVKQQSESETVENIEIASKGKLFCELGL